MPLNSHETSFGPEAFSLPFAYAGEGPEIGKSYGYKITGFVTHEPPSVMERARAALSVMLRRCSAVLATIGRRGAPRPRVLAGMIVPLPAPPAVLRHAGAICIATMSDFLRRIVVPFGQGLIFAVLRYPGAMLALMLACSLAAFAYRDQTQAEALLDSREVAAELRLNTGSLSAGEPGAATWKPIKGRALPIFALEAPEFSGLDAAYAIRTRADAREDSLAWSEPRTDGRAGFTPLVLIVAQRHVEPDADRTSLYLDTTRRAAQYGLSVMRAAVPSDIATKFGTVEVADVILSADATTPDEQARSCLAFRHARDPAVFRVTGWVCAPRDRVVERPALTALLDRLSLVGAGADTRLHQIFVDADLDRANAQSQKSGAVRKILPWLDQQGERPQLKGERPAKSGKRA